MKKVFFRTPYNTEHNTPGEKNTLPSLTIPDQNMSIDEMLRRHAVGLPIDGARVPMYDEDENGNINDPFNGVNPKTLDLSELAQMRDEAIERVKEQKAAERKKLDESAAAARQKAIDDAVAAKLAEVSATVKAD